MDRKSSLALATLMLAAVSACDRHPAAPAGNPAASTTTAGPAAAVVRPADLAQVQALAFIVAIDEQEVAAAEQARGKKIDPRIRAYADLLHEEHSANLEQSHALADSAKLVLKDDADVMSLRSRGQADLERMAALDDDEYAQAYLAAMADGHADTLALIDERLLSAAQRPDLRQHLMLTRSHVEQHWQAAKELQTAIPVAPKPKPKARPAAVTDPGVAPTAAPPIAEPPVPEAPAEPPVTDSNTPVDNS